MGLKEEREAAGFSQEELARLARKFTDSRINQSTISRLERGETTHASFDVLDALSRALRRAGRHVAPEDLLPRRRHSVLRVVR